MGIGWCKPTWLTSYWEVWRIWEYGNRVVQTDLADIILGGMTAPEGYGNTWYLVTWRYGGMGNMVASGIR